MADEEKKNIANFRISRAKDIKEMYSDEMSRKRRQDTSTTYAAGTYKTAAAVRDALAKADSDRNTIVETSQKLYATNAIYQSVIDYLANMFYWRYKVIPHKIWTKSKIQAKKQLPADDFRSMYGLMLEVCEGLSIETKFPAMLTKLFIEGAVYWTTVSDDDSLTIDTILLPAKYCRKIGETQFGTAIIEYDFTYFDDIGLRDKDLNEFFKGWPSDFKKGYSRYKKDSYNNRWQTLEPVFSSGILMNDTAIPTLFYMLGGILDYEKYQDNELERNENLLRYLVVHTMPHYEDNLIFEMDEVKEIHRSIKRIVDTGDKARLITTYGDVHVDKISENDTSENQVLSKAFKAIFNNVGFNSALFTAESVEALKASLTRDKSRVWKYIQILLSFYNITVNNWFDFKGYQADIDILQVSPYTYNDDIKTYRENATLGVNKIDYIIASGLKQKNIQDTFDLEKFLDLSQITPLQTSYTQTAEDRVIEEEEDSNKTDDSKKSKIEPLDETNSSDKEPVEDK